jgi:hypothetical protein
MGFLEVLTLIFIVLKLIGEITWPWLWVLAPLWIGYGIALAIFVLVLVVVGIISLFDS